MGLIEFRALLKSHKRIALDTNIFIYQIEANPAYAPMTEEVFSWLERAPHSAVTSTITMAESLVRPYRAGNEMLVNEYYALLSTFPNLEWVAPDLTIADASARIRAQHGLRMPDALQIATGICKGATAVLTNDAKWGRVSEIEVVLLDSPRVEKPG